MDKYIYIINGTGGSGKDTFVELVSKYAEVLNVSSVDKVKEIAIMIGWDGKKTEKDRKFLSDLKKLTTEYNDMAYNDIVKKALEFKEGSKEIMFIHIREPEEIKRAVESLGAKTLLIKREGLDNISSNYSDASVDNYDYDLIIHNTTLEKLEKEAINFVNNLRSNEVSFKKTRIK